MKKIVDMMHPSSGNPSDYDTIKSSVERVISKCLQGLWNCDERGWNQIRFWLQSVVSCESHTKPLQRDYLPDTLYRYRMTWGQLIWYCHIAWENEYDSGLRLNEGQMEKLQELRNVMTIWSEGQEDEMDERVLSFSDSLIRHSDYEVNYSAIKHFTGVLGYDSVNKAWRSPLNYTPVLAHIQFCMRVIGLESALPQRYRDSLENPFELFQIYRRNWLVDDEGNPFAYVHKLMQYGMKINTDLITNDKIRYESLSISRELILLRFSIDKSECFYEGKRLSMNSLKEFVKDLIRQAEKILSTELQFREEETVSEIDLYTIVDYQYTASSEYSFLEEISEYRRTARKNLLANLQRRKYCKDFVICSEDFQLEYQATGIKLYRRKQREFLNLLAILVVLTCGSTGRGTEMLSVRYKNKNQADRNVFILEGQVMLYTEYHKSQQIMQDVKVRIEGKELLTK